MSKSAVRWPLCTFLFAFLLSFNLVAQNSPRPLRASEVLAVEAGGALQANIAHDIASRGLDFHPTDDFLSLTKKAGADANVLEALKTAKVASTEGKSDPQLLQQLRNIRMRPPS
jgi:hypothetical protein